jgi:hypothetical protein
VCALAIEVQAKYFLVGEGVMTISPENSPTEKEETFGKSSAQNP